MNSTQQLITGQLNDARVAAYFKKCGATITAQRVQRDGYVDYLLTDGIVMVRVAHSQELAHFLPDAEWQQAVVRPKEAKQEAHGPDQQARWKNNQQAQEVPLSLTRELYELPTRSGKPGTLYRKLIRRDTQDSIFVGKAILDMFSPDLYDLEGFRFEQMGGTHGAVRVAALYGFVALIAPLSMKEEGQQR